MLKQNAGSEHGNQTVTTRVTPLRVDRRAVTAVEYAIIVGVMVAALVISVPLIGKNLTNIFTSVATPL